MIRVLFVCLGNICRSPMADALFQQKVRDAGLSDQFKVDSAGTAGYHQGETAHRGTLRVLANHDIPYNGRSRKFTQADFDEFDYILAMDRSNLKDIKRMAAATDATIRLFLQDAKEAGAVSRDEVPDPWYHNNFQEVYSLVERGTDALLQQIRQEQNI